MQDNVNWEVGQQVLITTSIFLDCPDWYAAVWCKPCSGTCTPTRHQNEVRTIVALRMDPTIPVYAVQLNAPLSFNHYGGVEYQSEVALLSRRINFKGEWSGDNYGGHIKVQNPGEGRFSGAAGDNLGQLNVLGRYPFHFHMLGDNARSNSSYFQECVVTHSPFRAFVVHGTNQVCARSQLVLSLLCR